MRLSLLLSLAVVLALPGAAAPSATGPVRWAYVLELDSALASAKPLTLFLGVEGGQVKAAAARGWNAHPHDADAADLKVTETGLTGQVRISLIPDCFFPPDGKPVAASYSVEARLADGKLTGTFSGNCGEAKVQGAIAGTRAPQPDPAAFGRLRARFFHPLLRLWQARGSNYKYALDMNLTFSADQGQLRGLRFETIVPDYRRYQAVVRRHALKFDGFAFRGDMEVMIDYGGQGQAGGASEELHTFAIDGVWIGDFVGGTYSTRVAQLSAKGDRFIGTISRQPPPAPAASVAFLRLHDAMQDKGPVLLTLALNDKSPIHGFAFASAYNHQPHPIDASGLKLQDNRLRGPVRVSIRPDCYRPPERFTMEYTLDAVIVGYELDGQFAGQDRGQRTGGAISGEVRARRPTTAPVTAANLGECLLKLGWCMPAGARKEGTGANVLLRFRDGQFASGEVLNPGTEKPYAGTVQSAQVELAADRLTGVVEFALKDPATPAGAYRYSFEAIVDGDALAGWWIGHHEGKEILTKSAKLHGHLKPVPTGRN